MALRQRLFLGLRGRGLHQLPALRFSGTERILECRWEQFFAQPSQWWDHRLDKTTPKYPDFTHKKTHEGLWIEAKSNPKWVEEELAAMVPGIVNRNPFAWNVMITRHVKEGQEQRALDIFREMQQDGVLPDKYTFIPLLNACGTLRALDEGRRIHSQIIENDCERHVFVATSLLHMYARCGSIEDAERVFRKMPERTLVSWNAMIRAFVKCGRAQDALELNGQLQKQKVKPDAVTFVGFLNACASLTALDEGKLIHEQIVQQGLEGRVAVGNSLIDMYAKCGSLQDAVNVFDKMPTRDVVSWNAMIAGYVRCGEGKKALVLSQKMHGEQVEPDSVTFVGILNACASAADLERGKRVHEQVVQGGFESDVFVASSLVDMYAKCGSIEDASVVFTEMQTRTAVSWNAMIAGYVKCGQPQKALDLFQLMQAERWRLDSVTFVAVLNACTALLSIEEGRHIHAQILKHKCEKNVFVTNSLVTMYAKCGSIEDAWQVFSKAPIRSTPSWNAMIGGYVNCGEGLKALELYEQMQRDHVKPNDVTYVEVINACTDLGDIEKGRSVHAQVIKNGYEADVFVGSCLVDLHAKCGTIEDAFEVFDKMPLQDVVAWNSIIHGCVRRGQGQRALELFEQMQTEQVVPEPITFVAVLNACASLADLDQGHLVHAQINKLGCAENLFVGNSLIDMYAKCGSIDDAAKLFEQMPVRDMVSWNSMLGGYATNGLGLEAIHLFEQMCQENLAINKVTFVSLLSACSHAGLEDEGLLYFHSITPRFGIPTTVEHYSCMVDLICRAGRLHEAENLIKSMPCEPDVVVWKALLGGCRVHGNLELGERIAQHVLKMDPRDSSGYVLLSNIYANAGKWDSKAVVHIMMAEKGVKKQPGRAWITLDNKVHTFIADDQGHPQILEIRTKLKELLGQIVEIGYVPNTRSALHKAKEEQKVNLLWEHSEKLAVAFGLLNTSPEKSLLIVKNLRVCEDCHNAFKLIADVTGRTIVVRDTTRFHHFSKDGCSCRDYW